MTSAPAWIAMLAASTNPQGNNPHPIDGTGNLEAQPAPSLPPHNLDAPLPVPPRANMLLLFAAQLDGVTLTETLTAYGDPADPLLPIGELSRLLEMNLVLRSDQQMVTGHVGESLRAVTIDLVARRALVNGNPASFEAEDVKITPTEVYLRASVLTRILPLEFTAHPDDLLLDIAPTEKLPVQQRQERQRRIAGLDGVPEEVEAVLHVAAPYRWAGPPAFDIGFEIGSDSSRERAATRFEGRVAGDLLQTTVSGYFASDQNGRFNFARLKAERRSATGELLGPLQATYLGAGDVYTPALALGPRSAGGAGIVVSSSGMNETSVFERINLRGELPIGYDVELYVNDVLRNGRQGGQSNGRYEFDDVPLVRGRNVVRVVFYGPRGERTEDTRIVNVGGGQLAAGKLEVNLGVVAQDDPVFSFSQADIVPGTRARGSLRAVLGINYGITAEVTAAGGLAVYSDYFGMRHEIANTGLRTSMLGLAMQADAAFDFRGGSAVSLSAAGRGAGIGFLARHAEYQGSFVDEANVAWEIGRKLSRYSELTFDLGVTVPKLVRLPLSGRIDWSRFDDGGSSLAARGRTTFGFGGTIVSLGADYLRKTDAQGATTSEISGTIAAARLIDYKWQLRGYADYRVSPRLNLRSLGITLDRPINERYSLRLGANQTFRNRDLSLMAGVAAHLPFAVASLNGDWSTSQNRWRVSLQLNFGFGYDTAAGCYRMTPPGPANSGSAAVLAFVDNNANGRMDSSEKPVGGIRITGAASPAITDGKGRVFLTGLGDGGSALIRFDTSNAQTNVVSTTPELVGLEPRPGSTAQVIYAMVPSSEVIIKLALRQRDGTTVGLSAVRLQLVSEKGSPIGGQTEFDGTAILDDVKPGRYRLILDEAQAERLRMTLRSPVEVVVFDDGRTVRAEGEIVFQGNGMP